MQAKVLMTIINVMFVTYMILLISFYFLHETMRENINLANFNAVDSIAIDGIFSEETFNNLKSEVLRVGGGNDYQMQVKYEKKVGEGKYDTFYISTEITKANKLYPSTVSDRELIDPNKLVTTRENNYQMKKGDKISIYLEDKEETLYGRLVGMTFLGSNGAKSFKIKSMQTTIIGNDGSNLVKGYDIIAEINNPNRVYKIYVNTELADGGSAKLYSRYDANLSSTRYTGEAGSYEHNTGSQVGRHHIFPNAYYSRRITDIYNNGVLGPEDYVEVYQTIN